jgi:hypothetical protein
MYILHNFLSELSGVVNLAQEMSFQTNIGGYLLRYAPNINTFLEIISGQHFT